MTIVILCGSRTGTLVGVLLILLKANRGRCSPLLTRLVAESAFLRRKHDVELAGPVSSQDYEKEPGEVDIGRTGVPVSTESSLPPVAHFPSEFTIWETSHFFHVTLRSHRTGGVHVPCTL